MKSDDVLNHPKLRKFIREVADGAYLFHEGEPGTSMFVVLEGLVELVAENGGHPHVAGRLEAGEFLGEKAFLEHHTAHPRRYGARAHGSVRVLEISHRDLDFMKIAAPELILNVMVKAFAVAVSRLENVNYLVQALRSSDHQSRLIGVVLYFCRTTGKDVPQGTEVVLTPESLHFHIDMETTQITHGLQVLIAEGLLERFAPDSYLVPSIEKLEAYRARQQARAAA